ncbi:DUF4347 domain-containing protein, partial [Geitlerinema sp. P-1104]|uniref:DUF4347 domain-containing protein n=1 Tax=Geitlerinema sp. P-1104 TaxID=2546230 RepID=UPI001476FC95
DTSSGIPDWGEGKGDWAIALYGCQVAAGDAGAEFVEKLHDLTGATISASTRVVGHADLGGTWNLDVQQGLGLVPGVILDESVRRSYGGVFSFDLGPTKANEVFEISLNDLFDLGDPDYDRLFPATVTTDKGVTLALDNETNPRYDPRNLDVFRALPEFEEENSDTYLIDKFTFEGVANSSVQDQLVRIKVRGVNEAPVASNFSIGIGDPPLLKNAIFDDITDPDDDKALRQNATDIDNDDDDLRFSGPNTSSRGAVVTINADGTYTYDPRNVDEIQRIPDGQTITDTFQYTVKDPGGLTDSGTVTVQIRGLNTAVVANDNEATVRRGESVTIPVLANDTNIEGGP